MLSVSRVLAPAWFLVVRLDADPHRRAGRAVLPLERRLVLEAEPGDGLELGGGCGGG